jgi:hypothetical protein
MSKKEKLIKRLKSKPKDLTFDEIVSLLKTLGFRLSNKGKSSGSRASFIKESVKITMHKPHGKSTLLEYQVTQLLRDLEGLI